MKAFKIVPSIAEYMDFRTLAKELKLGARELFEHLKDKTPAYYYENVLIASGKTLSDFLGGAA